MSTVPDRHPHPSRLLRHVDDTSVLTKRSFPSVFAGRDAYAGATLARYVSQLVPSKIPTRQWSLRGRAAWATCDPGGARSTPGDRYQRRVEHVIGVKRAVHALERGHAPRLSPTVRAPSGTTSLSNVRPSVARPFEYPLTLFPPRLDRRFNPDGCHRSRAGSARRRQGTTLTDADPPPAASRGARRPTRDDTRAQPRDPRIDPQEHSFLGSDRPIRGHRRILLPAKNIYLEDDGR